MPPKKSESKSLKLVSPFGAEAAVFKWPLESTEHCDGGNEIVEIMKSVCEDYPELALPIKNHIIKDFDSKSYDSVKSCCDKFNRAIAQINLLFSGTYRPGKHRANPSKKLLKHIIQLSYNRAVDDPEKLNEYEPFSPQVYGETSFDLICKMLDDVPVKETDTFIDLGSGVGQVVLQVAALTNCKMCYGIEKSQICVEYSTKLEKEFRFWMKWYGKVFTDFELIKGDFLDKNYAQIITNCSYIFVNNFAFGPNVDHQLKLRFQQLHDGTRIVASKAFASTKFRTSGRNMSDIASIMRVSELASLKGSVSWTENPVSYFLHVIDSTLLESYFEQQKMKSSSSRSGSDDTGSDKTDSGESNGAGGGRSDVESPPIAVSATAPKETAEPSTTSTVSTKKPVGSSKAPRKYPRRSSRKNMLSSVRNTANDSSSSTSSGAEKKLLSHYLEASKPTSPIAATATTSTSGRGTGRRKPTRKSATVSPPSSEVASKTGSSPSAAKHRKLSPRGPGASVNESGLEMLHSHSLMSTKGEVSDLNPVSEATYSPRRDGSQPSRSSTYKELNVRVEDLEALSNGAPTSSATLRGPKTEDALSSEVFIPGLDELMADMKNKYIEFVQQLQSPYYASMLQQKIQEERERGQSLRRKIQEVTDDMRELEKEFVQVFHCRLKELGIEAKTEVEFVEKAKSIISVHETLRMRTREEQELYNREYEQLQRNIEVRRAEYEEIAARLQREQGTVLPPFDVNLILNLKQQPLSSSAGRQVGSESEGSPRAVQLSHVDLIKRGEVVDLDTLIANQLQRGDGDKQTQQLYHRLAPPTSMSNMLSTAPANVSMCRGCGGVAAQKSISVSSITGFCAECEASRPLSTSSRASPRTQQLLQRSLETALGHSSNRNDFNDLGPIGVATPGRAGSCFTIENLVSPRLHQGSESQLNSSSMAQHSEHGANSSGGNASTNFCLPLSALSSPILRAGLTNPTMQKSDTDKQDVNADQLGAKIPKYGLSPISSTAPVTGPAMRGVKHALSFPKFEDYNKKRGTWDLSPSHPKGLPFTDLEKINQLVEKVAVSTCKLLSEDQEDLCYKCILIGHLPSELRPEWEDPRSQGSDYSTPVKMPALSTGHPIHPSNFTTNAASSASSPMHSNSQFASSNFSSTVATLQTGGSHVSSVSGTNAKATTPSPSYTAPKTANVAGSIVGGPNSQWQSERLAAESQERINSVISQVLRSSTQPTETVALMPSNIGTGPETEQLVQCVPEVPVCTSESVQEVALMMGAKFVSVTVERDTAESLEQGSENNQRRDELQESVNEKAEGKEVKGEHFNADHVEEEEEEERMSQLSSLNASTIAGERETESANVSMCSATDSADSTAAAHSQDLDGDFEEEEVESMDTGETLTGEDLEHPKEDPADEQPKSSESAFNESQDSLEQKQPSEENEQPAKDVKEDAKVEKTPVAITKKDVAKQFQNQMREEKLRAEEVGMDSSSQTSTSVVEKEELEVKSVELPAQLLTESLTCEVTGKLEEPQDNKGKEEGVLHAETSWNVAQESKVALDSEILQTEEASDEAKQQKKAEEEEHCDVKEEIEQSSNVDVSLSTNFDFSQINFDKTDFADDEDKK